jgi:hypothetical protein
MIIVSILRLLYLVDPSYALLPHDGGEGVPRAAVHGQAARHLLPILQQPLHLQQEEQRTVDVNTQRMPEMTWRLTRWEAAHVTHL